MYSESLLWMDRPQGWHSQTPSEAHVHAARRMYSGSASGPSAGLTSEPSGAETHDSQRRRWRSRRTTEEGGLEEQFWEQVS